MTQDYYGTKRLSATPMTRGEYNQYRGWTIPADENPDDEGYIVMYSDGYVSWSPRKQFDEAYRPVTGMSFGHALEAMKAGKRVARAGWNGKDMRICKGEGNPSLPASAFWNPHTRAFAEAQPGQVAEVLPYIIMKTAGGEILMGWLASQSDMLAEDWVEL
jgi:hypothetical protein